jgi:hypothetical protein
VAELASAVRKREFKAKSTPTVIGSGTLKVNRRVNDMPAYTRKIQKPSSSPPLLCSFERVSGRLLNLHSPQPPQRLTYQLEMLILATMLQE